MTAKTSFDRSLVRTATGMQTADGDGVKLTRIIGSHGLSMLDPFLLFDAFGSDRPLDYIGGFPPHPHRGFETVTYMLEGKMRHQDSAGNNGVISAGDVQWMTAGSGIIHSEMPEQEQGRLAGFQLWVNLPAKRKMTQPAYQEYASADIPVEQLDELSSVKVIAGKTLNGTEGVITNPDTNPTYLDVTLAKQGQFNYVLPASQSAFVYVIHGEINVGNNNKTAVAGQLGLLSDGHGLTVVANADSRFLLIAGEKLNEPVARRGPFVMNTEQEIYQAVVDYQSGNLVRS